MQTTSMVALALMAASLHAGSEKAPNAWNGRTQLFVDRIQAARLPDIAILAMMLPVNSRSEVAPSSDPLDDPNVLVAIKTAWNESMNGTAGIEASFRLDGSPSRYRVVVTPPTNQHRRQSVGLLPGATFAIFHVHTVNGDPPPSPDDRRIADRYQVKMYTIHREGIFVYDPATRKPTTLRHGVQWMIPGR